MKKKQEKKRKKKKEKKKEKENERNEEGEKKKVEKKDGEKGKKEKRERKEKRKRLKDQVQNGGGALMDFGCYGANLMTSLMKGEQPVSVTAVTQHFKPGIYPKVEDDATIVVTYRAAQCIIKASENRPIARKDMVG